MPEQSWSTENRTINRESTVSSVGPVTEHATIGASVVIKGELSGMEPLFIDGTVEGAINVPNHRVTVGRSAHITADIHAHDVVIMGSVKGDIHCSDLLDIRSESSIQGHVATRRIRIDDGAALKGSVEVHAPGRKGDEAPGQPKALAAAATADKPFVAKPTPVPTPVPAPAPAPPAATQSPSAAPPASTNSPVAPATVKRVPGSSTLLEPTR